MLWIILFIGTGLIVEKVVKKKVLTKYFQVDKPSLHIRDQWGKAKASIISLFSAAASAISSLEMR